MHSLYDGCSILPYSFLLSFLSDITAVILCLVGLGVLRYCFATEAIHMLCVRRNGFALALTGTGAVAADFTAEYPHLYKPRVFAQYPVHAHSFTKIGNSGRVMGKGGVDMLTEAEYYELSKFQKAAPNKPENETVQNLFMYGFLAGGEYWNEEETCNLSFPTGALPKSLVITEAGRGALKDFDNKVNKISKYHAHKKAEKKADRSFQLFNTFLGAALGVAPPSKLCFADFVPLPFWEMLCKLRRVCRLASGIGSLTLCNGYALSLPL